MSAMLAHRSAQASSVASTSGRRARPAAVGRVRLSVSCAAHNGESALPRQVLAGVVTAASAMALMFAPMAEAVSGGGGSSESFAGKDFSGQDLRKYKLTKANLRQANLSGANLEGVSLFGSLSEETNFAGANLKNADLESGNYENADFTNAILEGAFVNNAQFIKVKITGSDWTDVVMRKDMQKALCAIADGVNPVTNVATRDSLYCPAK